MKKLLALFLAFAMVFSSIAALAEIDLGIAADARTVAGSVYAAQIGEIGYTTFKEAMTAANAESGAVEVEIYGEVEFTNGMELKGNYDSITFTGKAAGAKITINQTAGGDYLEAHGKTVAFNNLILAKANPTWSGNSGHMGNYFSIQGGTITYTDCTFPNGACTSGGDAIYNNCTFQNASEYGLWVYDDALVTVNGGTIDSKKGIKVYSEDETTVTSTLKVENVTFTEKVTAKPAVAIGYAESIELIGNTYNNPTVVLELDSGSDANCEGITFTAKDAQGNDIASTLKAIDRAGGSGSAPCGVFVTDANGVTSVYTSVTTAATSAVAGDKVTLLYATDDNVEFADGVIVDTNNNSAPNVTATVAKIGDKCYKTFAAAVAEAQPGDTIVLVADVTNESTITLNGINLTAAEGVTLTNSGKLNFTGECTIVIPTLVDTGDIQFLDGAIIKDSYINGGVLILGIVKFHGNNTFDMIYDFGAAYSSVGANWTVEPGASVKLTSASRHGLGYGDIVTIKGQLTNALNARANGLTNEDAAFFVNGISMMCNWDEDNYLTVEDAYVVIGSNNSFGTKGDYGVKGKFYVNFDNSVLDSSRITLVANGGKATFNFNKSDVKTGVWSNLSEHCSATFTDSKLLATGSGTDYPNKNAGQLTLKNSDIKFEIGTFENTGTITLDTKSTITAPALKGTGSIVVDMANYDGISVLPLITADMSEFTGSVSFVNAAIEPGYEIKDGVLSVFSKTPAGGPIYAYTSENSIWGETNSNAKESYIIKVYSNETFMGQSSLNDIDDIIDGSVNVTWSIKLGATPSTEGYWNMSWEKDPSVDCIPTHVALEVDGVEVSRCALQLNGPDNLNKIYAAVADETGKITAFKKSFKEALTSVKSDGTVVVLRDETIKEDWDCRKAGKTTIPVTIDGNGHTLKFTGKINDGYNYLAVFRPEAATTFKNLTVDMSAATAVFQNRFSVIASKSADLTVDNCKFIGNSAASNARAIIYGEGGVDENTDVSINNSVFTNFKYGVVDNMNGNDVKSITITNSNFTNSSIQVSASKTVAINGNKMDGGYISVSSYSQPNDLAVTVKDNTIDNNYAEKNVISCGKTLDVQEGFILPSVEINGVKYANLQEAVDDAVAGTVITLTSDVTLKETLVIKPIPQTFALRSTTVPSGITLDLNNFTLTGNIVVEAGAVATIKDGKIVNENKDVNAIESYGEVVLTNVDATSYRSVVRIEGGVAEINGGSYKVDNKYSMTVHALNVSGDSIVTVKNGAFVANSTRGEESIAVKSRDNAVVTIENGTFTNGVATTLYGATKNNIVVKGGTFDQDPTDYVATGYDAIVDTYGMYKVVAAADADETIKIKFEEVETVEGEALYNINVVANDAAASTDVINRLNSADLTFEFIPAPVNGGNMAYEILEVANISVTKSPNKGEENRYMFSFDGKTGVTDTANTITIGQFKVTGYGSYTVAIVGDNNEVHATTKNDNVVDTYIPGGKAEDGEGILDINATISDEVKVPVRTLKVQIAFPNTISGNAAAYQDMKVEISGNIDGKEQTVKTDLGAIDANGGYVVTENRLVLNNTYNVTVSGAGYRTARYTVTMTEDKTLNFWNNVKDNPTIIEVGKETSTATVTFLAGDIVKDNNINIYDLSAVVSYFGTIDLNKTGEKSDYAKYDLNRDGKIDSKDVAYVLVSWGK